MIGKMSAGNLLISAATLFCGQTFTNVDQFADYMNLNFIGKIYILHHSACVLMLAVEHTWNLFQKRFLERVKSNNRTLRLAGDGRCGTWSNRPPVNITPFWVFFLWVPCCSSFVFFLCCPDYVSLRSEFCVMMSVMISG